LESSLCVVDSLSLSLQKNPDAKIVSLGIGDTTMPIPDHIRGGLLGAVEKLGVKETYSGYGAEQGMGPLREKIASELYQGRIKVNLRPLLSLSLSCVCEPKM